MTVFWSVAIYVIAFMLQGWLMWRIDRRVEKTKAEFLATVYLALVLVGAFVALRFLRGESSLAVDRYGFGAMFVNILLYTSVGLAGRPTRKVVTPYLFYSGAVIAGACFFVWWLAPRI